MFNHSREPTVGDLVCSEADIYLACADCSDGQSPQDMAAFLTTTHRSGSGAYDDRAFDDHRAFNDHRAGLRNIDRTRCRSSNHASCQTQKDYREQ